MKTREQVAKQFMEEFQALLNKYDAEIDAKDHYIGYPECGEDVRMTMFIPAVYDDEYNCVSRETEIDLGGYWSPTKEEIK